MGGRSPSVATWVGRGYETGTRLGVAGWAGCALLGGDKALQLLKPILDEDELSLGGYCFGDSLIAFDHQEALAVGGYVPMWGGWESPSDRHPQTSPVESLD